MFGRLGITFYSVAYLSFFKLLAESLWFNAICSFWKNSRTDNSAATGSCGTWILTPEIGTVDFREAEDTFGMSGSGRLSWTIRGLDVNSANWCRSTAETGYWSALTSTQRSSPSCPPTIIKNRIIFLIQFRTNCLKLSYHLVWLIWAVWSHSLPCFHQFHLWIQNLTTYSINHSFKFYLIIESLKFFENIKIYI